MAEEHNEEVLRLGRQSMKDSEEGMTMLSEMATKLSTRWNKIAEDIKNPDLDGSVREMIEFIVEKEVVSWSKCAAFMIKLCEITDVVEYSTTLKAADQDELMLFEFSHAEDAMSIGYVSPFIGVYQVSTKMAEVCESWINGANEEELNEQAGKALGGAEAALAMKMIAKAAGGRSPDLGNAYQSSDVKDGKF